MTGATSRQWILESYPDGVPGPRNFRLASSAVPAPGPDQVVVRTVYLSMDPFPRLRMDPRSRMGPPLPLGAVMIGRGSGFVVASGSAAFAPGDAVAGELGWQELATVPAAALRKLDLAMAPLSAPLHLLGSSGMAPYFALTETARVRAGETLVVTAAAGSVGLAAGQIATQLGARPVGIVRGGEQRRFLEGRFGYQAVIDGEAPDLAQQLRAACPQGIDVLIDSVGGALHDAAMDHIATHARIVLLGYISSYNAPSGAPPPYGRIYEVIRQRATVSGFLLPDFAPRFGEAGAQLARWMREGKLAMPQSITEGFENVPAAFAAMFGAAEPGKHLVRVGPESPAGAGN